MNHYFDDPDTPETPGCLSLILRIFGIRLNGTDTSAQGYSLPYRKTSRLLTDAELSFYRVLAKALPDNFTATCKPRLADIIFVPRGTKKRWAFDNRIQRKHVDFVICRSQTMSPQLVVELDDRSHQRTDRQVRDDFVDAALAAAGLPVLHWQTGKSYVLEELRTSIREKLEVQPRPAEQLQSPGVPECPRCRTPMVPRTAAKGRKKGDQFWGCENYPNCRNVFPMD